MTVMMSNVISQFNFHQDIPDRKLHVVYLYEYPNKNTYTP